MKKNIILISLLIIVYSCDLLTSREPENPTNDKSNQVVATTPEILFQNLTNSFKDKIVDNYLACLVDTLLLKRTFNFIPSAGSTSLYPNLIDWDMRDERNYFNNLIAQNRTDVPVILTLQEIGVENFGDSAYYQYDYSLTINVNDESLPQNYLGSLRFKINIDRNNRWVITTWEDIKGSEAPSWSELKGRFSN